VDDEPIRSPRNPAVVAAAALSESRERRTRGLHLAEGRRAAAEALVAGLAVELFVRDDDRDGVGGTREHVPAHVPAHVPVRTVAERAMARLATTVSPPGVVAVVRTPDLAAPLPPTGAILVLDEVSDPGNVGTLVRAADAAGCVAVLMLGSGADPFSPKAVRASAGSCYHLAVLSRPDAVGALDELRASGRSVHGLAADGEVDVFRASLPRDAALVVGNEARGLDPALRARLDGVLSIPMPGRAESLNVAAAGAVALFAALVGPRSTGLGSVSDPVQRSTDAGPRQEPS
jgi:RNA methyltransferase, TrmH family